MAGDPMVGCGHSHAARDGSARAPGAAGTGGGDVGAADRDGGNGARLGVADARMLLAALVWAALAFAWYGVWSARLAERSADEAIFENCLWNASHGNGLRSWLEGGVSHLAVHFSPVVWLFVPLYRLWPSMAGPHLVVCLASAAAGFALFRLARPALGAGNAAGVALAFLLNPTVVLQTFMEFHEQALSFLPL